jgi:outer membrane protein, heavy metal efflux system
LRVARALVGAGKEARLRQVQAETELNTLQADLENARAFKTVALARLSALAGMTTPFTGLSESLLDRLDAKPAFGPIDAMQATTVRVAEAEQDAAARAVTVQQRLAIPNVTAQLGVRQLRVASGPALVAGISVPLPFFDRNQGNIAAARAELQGAEARAAAARLEAEAGTRAGLALVEAADARAAAAQRTLTTAEEGYRLARIAYEAGKSPLIELLAARQNLGVARGLILDAAAARLDARANLARLQGLTITGEAVQ